MKNLYLSTLTVLLLAILACATNKKVTVKEQPIAKAILYETKNTTQKIGEAQFYSLDGKQIRMDLSFHYKERADSNVAVHFHEHGDCGNMGNNAHGHWNPTKQLHGKWGVGSYHLGDIGNLKLDNKGNGFVSITTDQWSVRTGDANSIIGISIIVHSSIDDYVTQPTGNSGPRIGCGIILK